MIGIAACGGKNKDAGTGATPGGGPGTEEETAKPVEPEGPPLPAAPADFGRADLVTISDGSVTGWTIGAGKVEKLGSVTLAKVDPEDYMGQLLGDWIDRDHLAVLIPPRDVVVISAAKIERVRVPPGSEFKTPRPTTEDDDGLEEGGVMEGANTGLVVGGGAAWWSECPWGYPYDGWQCEVYTKAKLWPGGGGKVETGDVQGDSWDWPTGEPKGYKLKDIDDGRVLGCTPPPGTKQKQTQLKGFEEDSEMVAGKYWVSTSPARLLVVWGTPGMDDLHPSRWTLHDGCLERPLAQGTYVEAGPAGLWIGHEAADPRAEDVKTRAVLRRGGEVIGELPDGGLVRFRPPAK